MKAQIVIAKISPQKYIEITYNLYLKTAITNIECSHQKSYLKLHAKSCVLIYKNNDFLVGFFLLYYKSTIESFLAMARMALKASSIQWSLRCDGKIRACSVDVISLSSRCDGKIEANLLT